LNETPAPEAMLTRLRHEGLRLAAPAVQHEVNNALMVLASNLDLLARSAAEGPPARQVARAQAALRRLDETIRGYLDAARRPVEEPAAVAPGEVLAEVAPLLRAVLGARRGFELEAGLPTPPARLDRARLDLALLALAREAAGRMADGARILARIEPRGGEVALRLTLPEGALPEGEAARLLAEAACGGRVEAIRGGLALVWPVA
jgi:signal transduction histidine kinase